MIKDDRVYILHIRDAIERILEYARGGKQEFLKDRKSQDAVVRNFEVMGEATKNLSPVLKDSHPGIPWKKIAGMRDKIIHEYFGVNMEIVWSTIENELPKLRRGIENILKS